MASKNPDKEDRVAKRCRRMGTHEPVCVACPESDPRCLEMHHIAGRKHHDDTAPLCRNCHRKLSDDQLDHPKSSPDAPVSKLAQVGHYLLGLCDLLLLVIATLRTFGEWLVGEAGSAEVAA